MVGEGAGPRGSQGLRHGVPEKGSSSRQCGKVGSRKRKQGGRASFCVGDPERLFCRKL